MHYAEDSLELTTDIMQPKRIKFTKREGLVFSALWRRRGNMVSHDSLRAILDETSIDALHESTVGVYVHKIRCKVAGVLSIETVRQAGYRMRTE